MLSVAYGCVHVAAAADVIEAANRFTVQISSTVEYPFGAEGKGTAKGAGFLIDRERGWIMTNAHVARRAPAKIRVSFKGEPNVVVERLYIDTHLDLAILAMEPAKIPASALAARLACDDEPGAGRAVIAFGHPWSLDYTATRGIVSGTKSLTGVEALQTDAALNPGNSGGPLIDEKSGVILGVNAATFSKSQSEGMNFAVPAKLACTIVGLLKDGKDPAPPVLPIRFAESLRDRELIVGDVQGAWAEALKIGDRILAVNGDEGARYASRVIDRARASAELTFRLRRGAEDAQVVVRVPGERKALVQRGVFVSGLLLSAPENASPEGPTVDVQYVERASLGEEASVRLGDVIHSINGRRIATYKDVVSALKGQDGRDIDFVLRRETPRERNAHQFFMRRVEIDKAILIDERGARAMETLD